jgi:hypothetical protein
MQCFQNHIQYRPPRAFVSDHLAASIDDSPPSASPLLSAAINAIFRLSLSTTGGVTNLIVLHACYPVSRNDSPFAICANPEFRVHFFLRDHVALDDVAHEEVVVHCVCDDLRYR